jgi:hypothetical protein
MELGQLAMFSPKAASQVPFPQSEKLPVIVLGDPPEFIQL